jgi:hypothetical protein
MIKTTVSLFLLLIDTTENMNKTLKLNQTLKKPQWLSLVINQALHSMLIGTSTIGTTLGLFALNEFVLTPSA